MKPVRMKGATVFDQCCHNVFSGHIDEICSAPFRRGLWALRAGAVDVLLRGPLVPCRVPAV